VSVFVQVVFPLPLDLPFTYEVPERLRDKALPGTRVLAPLGRKKQAGFIVSAGSEPPEPRIQTKEILEVLDGRPFWDAHFLSFTRALSAEYRSSWGKILQASLPPSLALKKKVTARLTGLGRESLDKKKLGRREHALAVVLADAPKGRSPLFLQRKTGLKNVPSLIARMARKGLVDIAERAISPPRPGKDGPAADALQLPLDFAAGGEPAGVLAPVERAVEGGRFASFYLFGSRASLHSAYAGLVRRVASGRRRTLLLTPGVALTEELIRGFDTSPRRPPAVFHGRMTAKQKEEAWRNLRNGRTALVAGTRSALFLDTGPLGLVIVDDEHEESYLQTESPAYDARRGAWLRARSENATVVFGSPRPTVEAFYEAGRNGSLLELGSAPIRVAVTWVDRRDETPIISRELELKIRENLRRDEPAILFLNRRGFAASLVCESCGRVPRCSRCDIPLVYHKREERLVCHYCSASTPAGTRCLVCGGRLTARKGAGTEALEEELKSLFARVPVARFDADTAGTREEREKILRAFSAGRIPLLVGTQFLAYQPGIPRVRLVGVLSPETLLGFSDYGAGQKTFQAVSRMLEFCEAGAGSEAVIQTRAPAHSSIQAAAAGDFRAFYEREIEFRRAMNYPPFAALAEVTLYGRDMRSLAARSRELGALLRRHEPELEVLGPALASVVRVRDVSRVQVVLKAARRQTIDRALDEALPRVRLKKTVAFSYSPFGLA
jgi:primosomal protein N' (replication factor Y)